MEIISTTTRSKILIKYMKQLFVFLVATFIITSCKVSLVPQRNEAILTQISQGQQTTDSVYDAMLNSSDKSFQSYASGYILVASKIADLKVVEMSRNKTISSQVDILMQKFNDYAQSHEDKGSLNNAEITTYKNDLDALWQPIYNSENFLK
jgi:hypothetical protein